MDSKHRWLLLSVAFAGTVAAILYPIEDEDGGARQDTTPVTAQRTKPALSVAAVEPRASWIAADADPFASKGWQAPPVAVDVSRSVQPVVIAADAPPPPPPPLPFKFVGQMHDGSDLVVYLSKGDQVVVARFGDLLDGGYKVSAISPSQIEFETVSSGLKQSLAIPAKEN
jgi:hypothetical protein